MREWKFKKCGKLLSMQEKNELEIEIQRKEGNLCVLMSKHDE